MKSRKSKAFGELEEHVISKLQYFKLQKEFKSLLSSVSHDLSSPLGYLKFSTEILTSQITDANKDVAETLRVIGNSTSKLNEEAIQIVEEAKSKLKTKKESYSVMDIVASSLEMSEIKVDRDSIKGDTEIETFTDFHLTEYLLSSVLIILLDLDLKPDSLIIESKNNKVIINLKISEIGSGMFGNIQEKLSELKHQQLIHSIIEYLEADISLYEKKSTMSLGLYLPN